MYIFLSLIRPRVGLHYVVLPAGPISSTIRCLPSDLLMWSPMPVIRRVSVVCSFVCFSNECVWLSVQAIGFMDGPCRWWRKYARPIYPARVCTAKTLSVLARFACRTHLSFSQQTCCLNGGGLGIVPLLVRVAWSLPFFCKVIFERFFSLVLQGFSLSLSLSLISPRK